MNDLLTLEGFLLRAVLEAPHRAYEIPRSSVSSKGWLILKSIEKIHGQGLPVNILALNRDLIGKVEPHIIASLTDEFIPATAIEYLISQSTIEQQQERWIQFQSDSIQAKDILTGIKLCRAFLDEIDSLVPGGQS